MGVDLQLHAEIVVQPVGSTSFAVASEQPHQVGELD